MCLLVNKLTLSQEEKNFFSENGFIKLKKLLTSEAIDKLRELTAESNKVKKAPESYSGDFSRVAYDLDNTVTHNIYSQENFKYTLNQLIENELIFTQGVGFELKPNKKGFHFHLDLVSFNFIKPEDLGYSLWIPLVPINTKEQHGGMVYVPRKAYSTSGYYALRYELIQHKQEERQLRVDLAAACRLIHYYGMTDTIYTHISARISKEPPVFLINSYGMLFDEICASNLVPIDATGNKIDSEDREVNPAGFTIHSAIHLACPDAHAIIHTHALSGMAVAAMEEGLLPLNQISMEFYNRVAYHDYEGISIDLDEQKRLVASLGDKKCLILRNHGLLTIGSTIAEAFYYMYYLNKACEIQHQVLSSTSKPIIPSPEICEHTAQQFEGPFLQNNREFQLVWEANRRLLDRLDPSYIG